jgi:hypothetical protein
MAGRSAASLHIQRSVPAIALCVLAFLFACEAKFAWYCPAGDLSSQVSAAKALRVDAPALVSHGTPTPDGTFALVAFSAIAILAAFFTALIETVPSRSYAVGHSSIGLPVYLLFPIDLRPPPAR